MKRKMEFLKKLRVLTLVLFSFGALTLSAQDFSQIGDALKSGNATTLAKYFDGNVEVTILNTEAVYSKNQAELVVKKFFTSNSPNGYKMVHNGDSGGAKYQIGELSTSSGTYRTYVYAKNKMGTWLIQEIRFEKN